ncbi:hypothetical protein ACFWBR_27255 [Streptomyces sp. NPDC060006]|uniref:hypothetical protein n=1 Tax=unclassified Streptomyces TaxID=2593676 RepID=UPI0036BB9681
MITTRRTPSDRMRRLTLADAACAPAFAVDAAPFLRLPLQRDRRAALLSSFIPPHQRASARGRASGSLPVNPPTSAAPSDDAAAEAIQAVTLLPYEPAEKPAFDWCTALLADEGAGRNARLRCRTWLTIARWSGNVDLAARVADKLVENAVRHAKPFADGRIHLRLIVTADTHELLVEVDDAYPEFPGFETVANQSGKATGTPTGLWWVAHYWGRLSWGPMKDDDGVNLGKTVQAILPVD